MTDETPGSGRHPDEGRASSTDPGDGDERTVRTPGAGSADTPGPTETTGPVEPVTDEPDGTPGGTPDDPTVAAGPAPGRVRYQDPDTTTPREPTVAEQRARREAEKRREAQEAASAEAEERKRKNRKRLLIGGGVAVGLVAVVAIGYAASSSDDELEARCTDPVTKQVVPDDNCGTQQGGYYEGGHFVPLFIPLGGFGGRQYNYTYGSNSPVGTVARGGSTVPPPSGTTLRGSSGTIGPSTGGGGVSRGGLGVGSNSSSGGSKGSSGSSSGS